MIKQANSKPINLSDDIIPRALPFHHHIINKYGMLLSWLPMLSIKVSTHYFSFLLHIVTKNKVICFNSIVGVTF